MESRPTPVGLFLFFCSVEWTECDEHARFDSEHNCLTTAGMSALLCACESTCAIATCTGRGGGREQALRQN